jgi:SAM-dependent methyltransferase
MSNFKNHGPIEPYCPIFLESFLINYLPASPLKTLDYGCGYGGWTKKIGELISLSEVCVFDIDNDAEKFTRNLVNSKLDFSQSDTYDLIMLMGVIECVSSFDECMDILFLMNKVLNPNGSLLLMTTAYEPLSLRWAFYNLRSLFQARKWHDTYRFKRTYFNHKKLESMLSAAGFEVKSLIHPRFIHNAGDFINSIGMILPSHFHDLSFYVLKKR